jgi:hypothetical protein
MKKITLSRAYQNNLRNIRFNTNLIAASWSIFYKGEYACGASYNGMGIISVCFPCGLQVYSKSLTNIKRYIRAYKQNKLEVL